MVDCHREGNNWRDHHLRPLRSAHNSWTLVRTLRKTASAPNQPATPGLHIERLGVRRLVATSAIFLLLLGASSTRFMTAVKDKCREYIVRLNEYRRGQLSFDFLTLHYVYIIGMTLLGSLLVFAGGNIRYIDALFLSSSCCTQAGLAPLNIEDLNTWQQVCLFLLPCFTNPIVIHSATAFVRLYWFQKRFAHIVKETNMKLNIRKTRSRALSVDNEERGVGGREIRVLFDSGRNQQVSSRTKGLDNNDAASDHQVSRRKTSASTTGDRLSFTGILPRRSTVSKDEGHDHLVIAEKEKSSDESASTSESSHDTGHNVNDGNSLRRSGLPNISRRGSTMSQAVLDDDDDDDSGENKDGDHHEDGNDDDQSAAHTYRENDDEQDQHPPNTIHIQGQPRANADIRFAELPVPRKSMNPADYGIMHAQADSSNTGRASTTVDRSLPLHKSRTTELNGASDANISDVDQVGSNIDRTARSSRIHRRRPSSASRFGGRSTTLERTITTAFRRRRDSSPGNRSTSRNREMPLPYISFQPTIGRNSAFTSLSREQRAELGGIEYRATKTLCSVLVCYFFGFHLFGFICFIGFIYTAQQYIPTVAATGSPRVWWSLFTSASSLNDLGLTLTPDSFVSFQNASFLLMLASFLIVIGNTGFPCMLRFVIWILYRIWPADSAAKEEFAFLLDHPRRCFTLLFPSSATWWLFAVLIGLNGLDLLLFIVLDLGNPAVTDIPVGYRIVDGLFQAFCTRTAGFTVVNIASLHSAILVSYMIMMVCCYYYLDSRQSDDFSISRSFLWLSAFVGQTFMKSVVSGSTQRKTRTSMASRRLSALMFEVNLGTIFENPEIQNSNLQSFNIFNVLFEIVSAYGTVGLSIGFPGVDFSFSGEFHTLSKLVVIALQIRGRHRGLPLKLDRAVLLPSEKLIEKEEEDAELRLGSRSMSRSMARQPSVHERQD